jgi:hypothetical protein
MIFCLFSYYYLLKPFNVFFFKINIEIGIELFKEVCLFDWVLRHTDTVLVIWRRSSFTDGGKPQVSFRALFQTRTGT